MKQKLGPEMPLPYGYYCSYDFTNGSTFFTTSLPTPSAAENQVIASKLGRNGFQRIQQFREYEPGWDFGRGQSMSEIAFSVLSAFLQQVKLPAGKQPSVFLTTAGHLELAWENESGAKVQAEFGPKDIGFYREDTGAEGELGISEVPQIAKLLAS